MLVHRGRPCYDLIFFIRGEAIVSDELDSLLACKEEDGNYFSLFGTREDALALVGNVEASSPGAERPQWGGDGFNFTSEDFSNRSADAELTTTSAPRRPSCGGATRNFTSSAM